MILGAKIHIYLVTGHATEPEAIVPLSGVLRKGGQVVLAGDPKQLGPVLRSPIALKHGLQISLLERLMNTSDIYKRDSITMNFHTKPLPSYWTIIVHIQAYCHCLLCCFTIMN